jgi:hypothetical protein
MLGSRADLDLRAIEQRMLFSSAINSRSDGSKQRRIPVDERSRSAAVNIERVIFKSEFTLEVCAP